MANGGSAFAHSLPVELALGLTVAVCVGLMLSLATPRDAWTAREQLGFFARVHHAGVEMTLRTVDPAQGRGAIGLDVVDRRPHAAASPVSVMARLANQRLPLESVPVPAPGVRRFGAAGAGTALGTASTVAVEYMCGALPPVTGDFRLPAPLISPSIATP